MLVQIITEEGKNSSSPKRKVSQQTRRESLEEKVREANGYKKARGRQRRLLESGLDFGTQGQITVRRQELQARR